MTLVHGPIDIENFWGILPKQFDIQSFIVQNLDVQPPMVIAPERGLGRRVLIDMFDQKHKKLIQLYSEITVADSPQNPTGYQEEDLVMFDGVVVGDVTLDEYDNITFWGATTYSLDDFDRKFVTDRGISLAIDKKMQYLREYSHKIDTILEHADKLWSGREVGQEGVSPYNTPLC